MSHSFLQIVTFKCWATRMGDVIFPVIVRSLPCMMSRVTLVWLLMRKFSMFSLQWRTCRRDSVGFVCEAHANSPSVWDVWSTYGSPPVAHYSLHPKRLHNTSSWHRHLLHSSPIRRENPHCSQQDGPFPWQDRIWYLHLLHADTLMCPSISIISMLAWMQFYEESRITLTWHLACRGGWNTCCWWWHWRIIFRRL